MNKPWCPQCGFDVDVDEDGCCTTCGATATGQGADTAQKIRRDLQVTLLDRDCWVDRYNNATHDILIYQDLRQCWADIRWENFCEIWKWIGCLAMAYQCRDCGFLDHNMPAYPVCAECFDSRDQ